MGYWSEGVERSRTNRPRLEENIKEIHLSEDGFTDLCKKLANGCSTEYLDTLKEISEYLEKMKHGK